MDLAEFLFTAIIIGAAIALSDWLIHAAVPDADYVDRESPWLDRFERPAKGAR